MVDTTYVVFNADDFGFSAAVNAAVLRAHRGGILTSASLMANMEGFAEAVAMARTAPQLGIGVHLNCLRGRPLLPAEAVSSALDGSGAFLDSLPRLAWRAVCGLVRWPEIEREWQAQIDRVTATGIRPTHLDSEKHCHLIFPALTEIAARLAARNRIRFLRTVHEPVRCCSGAFRWMGQAGKCRWLNWRSRSARAALRELALRTPDRFVGIAATGRMTVPYVETMLRQVSAGAGGSSRTCGVEGGVSGQTGSSGARQTGNASVTLPASSEKGNRERDVFAGVRGTPFAASRGGATRLPAGSVEGAPVVEFMFHPSIEAGDAAVARSFLRAQRRMEFETLCAPALQTVCAQHGIRAVHYGAIP